MSPSSNRDRFRMRVVRGMYKTVKEALRSHVRRAAEERGQPCPADDSTGFIRLATLAAPDLLLRLRTLAQKLGL